MRILLKKICNWNIFEKKKNCVFRINLTEVLNFNFFNSNSGENLIKDLFLGSLEQDEISARTQIFRGKALETCKVFCSRFLQEYKLGSSKDPLTIPLEIHSLVLAGFWAGTPPIIFRGKLRISQGDSSSNSSTVFCRSYCRRLSQDSNNSSGRKTHNDSFKSYKSSSWIFYVDFSCYSLTNSHRNFFKTPPKESLQTLF